MADRKLVETQSKKADGTDYIGKSVYLFVPSAADNTTTASDRANRTGIDESRSPGSYFRLGSYSDMEAAASTSEQALFYPRQHIMDSGNARNANYRNADGEGDAYSAGIMLACNGRVLIRSEERTYIHSKKKIHVDSDEEIGIKSGKFVSIKSNSIEDNYRHPNNRAAATKGIEIIGGKHSLEKIVDGKPVKNPGTGAQVFIEADELYLQVAGTSTAEITADGVTRVRGNQDTRVEGNDKTIIRGNTFEEHKGWSFSMLRGRSDTYMFGVGFSFNVTASLSISLAMDIEVSLISIGFAGTSISADLLSFSNTVFETNRQAAKAEQTFAESVVKALSNNTHGVQTKLAATVVDSIGIQSEQAGVDSNVKGLVSFL